MRLSIFALVFGIVSTTGWAQQTRPAIAVPAAAQAGSLAQGSGTSAPTAGVAATATADPHAPAVSAENYVIGAGDTLQLTVWKEPNLSSAGVPVRPDGRISLPLLGDVPAAGLTPMLLGKAIADMLKKFITDPLVTVTMLSVAPKEIYLIGQVAKTGPVTLIPGMNMLQAIAAAGGLTPYAKKQLYVLRKAGSSNQKIPFNYKKAIAAGDMQGITLMPGDTIVIP